MYFKSNCQSCHPKRYCHQVQCGRKVAEVFLDAGQKYLGEINQGQFLPAEEFCNIYAALCFACERLKFLATCLLAEVPDGHGVQYFLQTPDKEEYEGICS